MATAKKQARWKKQIKSKFTEKKLNLLKDRNSFFGIEGTELKKIDVLFALQTSQNKHISSNTCDFGYNKLFS